MITDPVPIFVISYNRGGWVLRCVESCCKLGTAVEIVIHDNGSDDALTLHCLDLCEAEGIRVVRSGRIRAPSELDRVNETVASYFSGRAPGHYVVTDCDVDMSIAAPDALRVYDELLDIFPAAACVGPMIRIRDVPRHYPLFARVMNRHIEQFWQRQPKWVATRQGPVAVLRAPIDTTFALHRSGEPFFRLKDGIRVYEPYEARHLDWYLTEADLSGTPYFASSSEQISHWNNRAEFMRNKQETLQYNRFFYVECDGDGRPRLKTFRL